MSGQAAALVGYCGLNCAECFNYNKTVSDASRQVKGLLGRRSLAG